MGELDYAAENREPPQRERRRSKLSPHVKWQGIVKVQRSLNDGGRQVLMYSQDGSAAYRCSIDVDLQRWFKRSGKEQHKFFAYAELRGTIINLVRKAPWQEW
jgi:hypothetical protein